MQNYWTPRGAAILAARILILSFPLCLATNPGFAEKRIDNAIITPSQIFQDSQPTKVHITVRIGRDTALIKDSVRLVQMDTQDRVVRELGQLWDDGTHGDQNAGDSTYSTDLTLNEPNATILLLGVLVSYTDSYQPLYKRQGYLAIQIRQTCQQAIDGLANAFEQGQLDIAKSVLTNLRVDELLDFMTPDVRGMMAGALRNATPSDSSPGQCVYALQSDAPIQTSIILTKGPLGDWKITNW